ncbi:triose-phosphate isomerase [Myroides odoratus]|uniref:Triosephosphate isomerase n=1 Tax=Myroides odoratus TaxID=256 RepID=A0A9Q6ZG75_MYROD|nr:triose-phosphate isomerase [Myroides odoratus]MDH6601317.1 triosephosphate isomerase [Myroides gitamensis]EHQ43519.1 triosephosphate isomerase [Myroides odoratus DSM 2801]EKB06186.1 triose-phosphate isomerase [Myroides odoratus CIP 103059]MCS4239470.1 triosephosphate isomerase [Myroides odoratus]QQU00850.1 triose-phosphate isomerase [Myroides odoratus]
MRHQIVAGNWKMHKNLSETHVLLDELIELLPTGKEVEVIVAPAFTNLASAVNHLEGTNIQVAAQNMHQAEGGAFTGEISAQMLLSVGVETVIIGHSERRHYFKETDAILADKVNTALRHNMRVIYCIGEELKDRESKQYLNVIFNQLRDGLFHLSKAQWEHIVIAYEPVWAIGTGETATPEQAQEIHAFIRQEIERQYDKTVAENTSILYGGSVKPNNAKEIFSKPDVDGGLIGGAALVAADFAAIVAAI